MSYLNTKQADLQAALGFPASWPQEPTPEQIYNYKMTTTPYTQEDTLSYVSPTNSSSMGIDDADLNTNYRYVAYNKNENPEYLNLISPWSVNWVSTQITARLKGLMKDKNIVVPANMILSIFDSYYQNGFWTGDSQLIREQTVLHIMQAIKNEYELYGINDKLSKWIFPFNVSSGLQQFQLSGFRLNEKQKSSVWNWNY